MKRVQPRFSSDSHKLALWTSCSVSTFNSHGNSLIAGSMGRSADHHPLAFPAVLAGSTALAFAPWLVRPSGLGAVAAGFWRLALGVPLPFAISVYTPHPL